MTFGAAARGDDDLRRERPPVATSPAAGGRVRRSVPARVWLPVGIAVALLAGLGTWALASSSNAHAGAPSTTIRAGRDAPGFDLPRLGGGRAVTLAADRGTPVVLNFFASWCPGCRSELRAFAVASRAAAGEVDFIGIDTNDTTPKAARSLLAKAGDRYPVGVDSEGATATAYRDQVLPATVFVTRSGTVAGESFGAQSVGGLDRWIHRLERST